MEWQELIELRHTTFAWRGIQSGLCQNICCDFDYAEKLFPIDHDERALDLRFVIGVGYGKDRKKRHEYLDPHIPYITHYTADVYNKPKFEEIVITDNA
jgi:hypothetical protein